MARWGMKLAFTDGTMETHGCKRKLQAPDTSHPCISLLEYPANRTQWFTMIGDRVDNALQYEPSDTFGLADNLRPEIDSDSDIPRCSDMPYLEDDVYDAGLFLLGC